MTRNSTRVGRFGAVAAVSLAAALVLASCGSSDSGAKGGSGADGTTTEATTSTTAASGGALGLDGKAFTATGVEGYEPVADSQLTLTFQDGNLSVNAGCNTLFSTYEVDGDQLAWSGTPGGTMMGCPDDLMNQDTWLIELFTAGVTAQLDGDELTLTSDDVTITLAEVADAPLEGTAWTLESVVADDAVSTYASGEGGDPTLTIAEDGTVQVFTGCNTGNTTAEVTDTTITFAPMAMTQMMCADAAEVEAAVTTVLDGETTYVIDGSSLTITKGDTGLIYTSPPST